MHVGRSHPFTLAPPPPESPFAVPMLLSPFPTLCIFLQPDYVRSRAFEHSHVLYPEESFLIRFPRSLFFLTRLFQGLPASWIRLHSPNQPVSALITLPRIGSRRILRSLAGEKSKFFEWIFLSRMRAGGCCISGLLDEYGRSGGEGRDRVDLNFRGNSIGVSSVI